MAAVVCTPAQVAPVSNTQPEIITLVAESAIERGDVLAIDGTTGKAVPCEAATGAHLGVVGVALNKVGAGQVVSVLIRGFCAGWTLDGNYGSLVYTSATGGDAADALVTTYGRILGIVLPVNGTKGLFICPTIAFNVAEGEAGT